MNNARINVVDVETVGELAWTPATSAGVHWVDERGALVRLLGSSCSRPVEPTPAAAEKTPFPRSGF